MKRRRKRREDGVSAVEFGLVLPLFIIILLGIMDYGWVYFVKLSMTNAAREGARVGVTLDTNIETEAGKAAKAYLGAAGFNPDDSEWSVTPDLTDPTLSVTVTVNPFKPLVGFVPTPASLSSTAAMRWELSTVTGSGS
jgi:Flp pilus assembly protein TadG